MKFIAVFALAGLASAATDDCSNARAIASSVDACEAYKTCLSLGNSGFESNSGFVSNDGFASNDGFVSNSGFASNSGFTGNDGFANSGFESNAGFQGNLGYAECDLLAACGEFDGCDAAAPTTASESAPTAAEAKCDSLFIGDGICDQECNTAEFDFDGGDCQ